MTKKKKKKKASFKLPLATVLGLAAGFVGPGGDSPIEYGIKGDYRSAIVRLVKSYVGYDANTGKLDLGQMASGTLPLIIGCLVSQFVGGWPLNVNRRIRLPLIKI